MEHERERLQKEHLVESTDMVGATGGRYISGKDEEVFRRPLARARRASQRV